MCSWISESLINYLESFFLFIKMLCPADSVLRRKKTLKIISACVLHAWFSRKQLNRKRAWPLTLFRVNATWRDNECARKIINFGTDVWSGTSKKLNLFLFLGKPYSYLLSPTYRSSISTKKWVYVGIIMKINLYFFFLTRFIARINLFTIA